MVKAKKFWNVANSSHPAFTNPQCWRVRFVLAWKGIEYESRAVNLLQGQQNHSDYTQLNPYKEVPTLLIDGEVLTQSLAIMEYLEETRPERPLLPKDPSKRAQVRAIVSAIACDIQPIQNPRVMNRAVADVESRKEWANYWITFGFEGLERILKKTAGTYCVGDDVTLADACLPSIVYNSLRFDVDLEKFPTIIRVNEQIKGLDAYRHSRPEVQEDCLPELKQPF